MLVGVEVGGCWALVSTYLLGCLVETHWPKLPQPPRVGLALSGGALQERVLVATYTPASTKYLFTYLSK